MRVKLRALPESSAEESNVSMLLTQSVFLGIFIGTFNIVSWTALLSTFDGKILAPGFLVSGITGIIFMFLYLRSKSVFRIKNFSFISLSFCTVLTILLCTLLYISSWQMVPFILFSMSVPLTMLAFFSHLENKFHLEKQEKHFTILAERSLTGGIALISLLIPFFLYLKLPLTVIMLISPVSLAIAAFLQYFIRLHPDIPKPESEVVALHHFKNDPSYRIVALFAGISLVIMFLIHYSLVSVARIQLLVDNDMATFLGFFTAGLLIITMSGKHIIFPSLLRNYGLRAGIIIPPAIIAIVILMVIVLRLILGINAVTLPGFFIIISLASLFAYMLILSVKFPTLRVIFRSYEKNFRDIFTAGTSWVILISLLISGVILTVAGLFFSGLIYFLALLIPLIAGWLYIAFQMHDLYRKQIFRFIDEEAESSKNDNSGDSLSNRFAGQLLFKMNYYKLISGDYSVLTSTSNKWYFEEIIDNAWSKKDINLLPVLKKISLLDVLDEGIRKKSSEVLNILQKKTVFFKYEDEKIAEAVKILAGTRIPQTTQILSLLRGNSDDSKKLAVYMIGKFGLTDLLSVVCDCLNNQGIAKDAFVVLNSFGRDAGKELIRFYLISSGNSKLSKSIVHLLQKVETPEAKNFLFSRLGSNSRQLKEVILIYLLENNFNPSQEDKQRLDQLASDTIGILTWNLSAKLSLRRIEDDFLREKIIRETERWEAFLFNTLSIIYGKDAVRRLRHSMSDRTIEGASVTSEIIDFFITGPVKPKLSAYFESPEKRRLEKLFQFYPGEITRREKLLEDIINRDYNLIGLWTKASALRSMTEIEGDDLVQSVIALLFSQEEIIQEESARLIARTNPGLYHSVSARLPYATKHKIDGIISGNADPRQLLYEKVQFLARLLSDIPEDELLPLASEMNYLRYFDSEIFNSSDGCIVWQIGEKGNEPHIFYRGETEIIGRKLRNRESFYILTLMAIEEYHFRFPEQSDKILKYVDMKQS